jgi:starch synthase
MKILMISPELTPFSKAGGLGDMVASLTLALAERGHDVRVFTPLYGNIKPSPTRKAHPYPVHVHLSPTDRAECRVWKEPFGKATAVFLEYNDHFGGSVIYDDKADNGRRFAFFTRAALDFCEQDSWYPDIVHGHDWTAGLAPVSLNTRDYNKVLGRAASVFTIHNLLHQGFCDKSVLGYAGLPSWLDAPNHLEAVGGVNLMKGGLWHATKITTVSPTYAKEIRTAEFGCGLEDLLRHRAGDLVGILNGVDTADWNPAKDPHIPANFSVKDLSGKAVCKAELQKELGLTQEPDTALFGIVSRLWDQKGLDLFADIAEDLLSKSRMQVALLGSGDKALEARFTALAHRFPGKLAARIGFDNGLSHRIEAGSDFFLMPSRFEPCGLNQMYSMLYGTLPIVRATGGLADTVTPWYAGRGTGTGIVFDTPNAAGVRWGIEEALRLYYDAPAEFQKLRTNAMSRDFGWAESARKYEEVYGWALSIRRLVRD